jgi:hypothetical protein
MAKATKKHDFFPKNELVDLQHEKLDLPEFPQLFLSEVVIHATFGIRLR